MSSKLTFEFSWPPAALSPNVSVHWRVLAAVKAQYKHDCGWIIRGADKRGVLVWPKMLLKPPVKAHVTFVNNRRRRDDDNARASLKAMWDAFVEVGVLEDDSHDKLTVTTSWEVGKPLVKVSLEEGNV